MKKAICLIALGAQVGLSACASNSSDISPSYVSTMQYQDYNCKQIGKEASRIARRVGEISSAQDDKASGDAVAMGVGMVLFWPALFFISGDDHKEEIARLKGEYEALEQVSIEKNCDVNMPMIKSNSKAQEKQRTSSFN